MLGRLVAMSIVAHVRHLHLGNLMDTETVVTVVVDRRNHEYGVQHLYKLFTSSHCIHKTVHIVEYRPCIMPCITFGERISPLVRTERLLE